ncbi:polar amino acid transport system permease protein [Arcanobacterium wilhelmae]|uniref:Polar amino acid transport system permease protein n=1 Tax=Arcanobacterium wilhelmae TaxID=1803177 RepID=A0ABT9N8P8_9ACTO|nr:amino acid ABC transporter permease [Arcanobacterium wilhelmae]MDP9800077.1 polar amino acid transport system permease protein [Arcanobacterium wilhelmae]WFN89571.1 amino acid ABC transporter permease [Arcanobacterium wilhelmae]
MTISVMLTGLLQGLGLSIAIFVLTLIGALPLGIPIAFARMSTIAPLRWLARAYISIMRGTPLMLQMLAIYFAPYYVFGIELNSNSKFIAAVVAFILNYAGYFAEIYRSGLGSIPRGQWEAADVLGYTRAGAFRRIIFPQVIQRILPATGNEVITLVKDTSLAFSLGILEMFSIAKAQAAASASMLPFILAGVIYWVVNFGVEIALGRIEKRYNYEMV